MGKKALPVRKSLSIVFVTDTFHEINNGITMSAMQLAKHLRDKGHTIRILTAGNTRESGLDERTGYIMFYVEELHVPVASTFAHRQNTLFGKPDRQTVKNALEGADVVHIFQPWPLGRAALKQAKEHKIPVIAAFHIQPENITYNIGLGWLKPAAHLIYYLMDAFFYKKFEHIHCPSRFIAAQLRKYGYKSWLHVVSNGVDPAFSPSGDKTGRKGDLIRILMVGRLSPEKRQDVLIRAIEHSKHKDRIQIYFAGRGPWKKKLEKLGKKLNNPPVFGYYEKKDLVSLIDSCDLYVHSSDIEIECISCLEAVSCGLVPVISDSKRSAAVQFALSSENLFKSGNPKDLAARIDYWLDSPEKRHEASLKYRGFARFYSSENSAWKMEKIYYTLSVYGENNYCRDWKFRLATKLFHTFFAVPIIYLWTRLFLGFRIEGKENIKKHHCALTLCNHVHTLDSAMVAIALYPKKIIYPTIPENMHDHWYGHLVRILGGVTIPDNFSELKMFMREMEIVLTQGNIVHFFPEGDLKPYDTNLREFKKGAFYLAAQTRAPIIPMAITFRKPKGLYRLLKRKPAVTLNVGKPLYPTETDARNDLKKRMEMAQHQMEIIINRDVANC